MPDKLTHQITVHMTQEEHEQIAALSSYKDISRSEYVLKVLITPHLEQKRLEFQRMARVFGSLSSMSSERAE